MKPNFSVCLIVKNEGKVIKRMLDSLASFRERGGEVCILDTGSTDDTLQIARSYGCIIKEAGEKYCHIIDKKTADEINNHFIIDNEGSIVSEGDKFFHFSDARNEVALMASNDWICCIDADEVFTNMDIDYINEVISNPELGNLEYQFIFSHDQWGNPAVQFVQSKFYNRTKITWKGMVHECISGTGDRLYITPDKFLIEHWQNHETGRHTYLKGLAVDCFLHPNSDRNSHYFARELFWVGKYKSAIKEFERHISMNKWVAEKAQSSIFIGDCYGALGNPEKQLEYYNKAFYIDSSRREPLLKIARFYLHNKNYKAAICYAKASMELEWVDFYANHKEHYTTEPHEILYQSYGWIGKIEEAKNHIIEAIRYQPNNPVYLRDFKYYFGDPKLSFLIPTLGRAEGLQKCFESIKSLNHPQGEIEILVIEGDETVPEKIKQGVSQSTGEWIVYAANDMTFDPDCIKKALELATKTKKRLISFNEGLLLPDKGNICTHFMIHRSLIPEIGGEIFSTKFTHCGVDNLLWAKCEILDEALHCEDAKIIHNHFSTSGVMDETYIKGWANYQKDRETLAEELKKIKER
jgi:glycosyltransferase involved in cell wall biosynthesis